MSLRGKERDFSLRSLSMLSKSANELYFPLLFQDLCLDQTTLHCFFRVQSRIPNAGELVRTVRLSNCSASKLEKVIREEKANPYNRDIKIPMWSFRKTAIEQFDSEGSQALEPFNSLIKMPPHVPAAYLERHVNQLHRKRVDAAIGLILDSLPNLQTFISCDLVDFPFGKRLDRDIKPLLGLYNSLKRIRIGQDDDRLDLNFTSPNAVFIMSLPNLVQAHLQFEMRYSDLKFFKEHESVFTRGMSKVTDLHLFSTFRRPIDWNTFANDEGLLKDQISEVVSKSMINMTTNLKRFAFHASWDAQLNLEGLRNSLTSLTDLSLTGIITQVSDFQVMGKLRNLVTLPGDSTFIKFFCTGIVNSASYPGLETFPPSLQTLILTPDRQPSDAKYQEFISNYPAARGTYFPEAVLAALLGSDPDLPASLSRIIAYDSMDPFELREEAISEEEKRGFESARDMLKLHSSNRKISFELVEVGSSHP